MADLTATHPADPADPGDPLVDAGSDPTGTTARAGSAGTGGDAAEQGRRRIEWRAVTGLVAFAYAVWASVDVLVLARSGPTFTDLHRRYGNLGVRLVFAGVVVALLHHGLDGLRVALEDLVPATRRADRWLRALTRFGVPAIGIPAALVLVWPAVRGWFA